jgi:formamidopyrimidine-DNA glycosylase
MPELPEVESLRRSLEPKLVGQKIKSIQILKEKMVSSNSNIRIINMEKVKEFGNELKDQRIKEVQRIAKHLIFVMDSGKVFVVHLKMTGQLIYKPDKEGEEVTAGGHPGDFSLMNLPGKHTHLIFDLEEGVLYYNDVRTFGYLLYYPDFETAKTALKMGDYGLSPFSKDFTEGYFTEYFAKCSGTVKKNFLEQKIVVGLGNIYADEVCFEAGVRPMRSNKSLKEEELKRLYKAIKRILTKAVEEGGSSISNYVLGDGSRGNYAAYHKVYNRSGQECLTCGTTLVGIKHAGRMTVYCPKCQP